MIVTFCGHSDFRGTEQTEKAFLDILEDQIGDTRCEIPFGQYGGFDLFSFRCGQKFKKCHSDVKMILSHHISLHPLRKPHYVSLMKLFIPFKKTYRDVLRYPIEIDGW